MDFDQELIILFSSWVILTFMDISFPFFKVKVHDYNIILWPFLCMCKHPVLIMGKSIYV